MSEPSSRWAGLQRLAELPRWLTAPEGDVVGDALTRAGVPLGGEIVACSRHATRLRSGHWAGRYDVRIRATDGSASSVAFYGELRPPGSDLAAPAGGVVLAELGLTLTPLSDAGDGAGAAAEPELPAMGMLTDPTRAAAYLQQRLGAVDRYAGVRIAACEHEVMRYKPGSRCTLRFGVTYEGTVDAPPTLIAKTHRGDKGLIAWRGMTALWNSPLACSRVVSIAEPLSYDAELRVLLQGPVGGERTLKDVVGEALAAPASELMARVDALLDATADGLAALHGCGAAGHAAVTLADDVAEATDAWRRLVAVVPQLEGAADELLAEVAAVAARPGDALVPSHRSFRAAQVLVDGAGIGFIDFDGFCNGEPALDVALFRATLRCYGAAVPLRAGQSMNERLDVLDAWCDRFLARYLSTATVAADRVAAWEVLDVFVHLQNAWTKARPARPAIALAVLERLQAVGGLPLLTARPVDS